MNSSQPQSNYHTKSGTGGANVSFPNSRLEGSRCSRSADPGNTSGDKYINSTVDGGNKYYDYLRSPSGVSEIEHPEEENRTSTGSSSSLQRPPPFPRASEPTFVSATAALSRETGNSSSKVAKLTSQLSDLLATGLYDAESDPLIKELGLSIAKATNSTTSFFTQMEFE